MTIGGVPVSGSFVANGTQWGPSPGTMTFTAVPATAAQSGLRVVTGGVAADGNTQAVVEAYARDAKANRAEGPTVISFASLEPNVAFNGGARGGTGSCTTSPATSTCRVTVTSNAPVGASYIVTASMAGSALAGAFTAGPLAYSANPSLSFAAAATAAQSGLRVVTEDVVADGSSTAVLEVYARTSASTMATVATTVNFASPDGAVSINGGARGAAGACTTSTTTGTCRVTMTSTASARYSVSATLGGSALAGNFSVGGVAYGPSPGSVVFRAAVARLLIEQVVQGVAAAAVNDFRFSFTGLQAASDTIRVTGAGSAIGVMQLAASPPRAVVETQQTSNTWPHGPASASCVDLASATPAVTFGTLLGKQLIIAAERAGAGANLCCSFVNTTTALVSGRLFLDTGLAGGSANDGLFNGGEQGLASVPVSLTDCAAGVFATTTSAADGVWRLAIPAAVAAGSRLCVTAPRSVARQSTGASVAGKSLQLSSAVAIGGVDFTYERHEAADSVAFAWSGGTAADVSGIDMGSVPHGVFGSDAVLLAARPGGTVSTGLIFTAGTAGRVRFSAVGDGGDAATAAIVADPGCAGRLQAGADVLFPPSAMVSVSAGERVCVVVRLQIPPQSAVNDGLMTKLLAQFDFTRLHRLRAQAMKSLS